MYFKKLSILCCSLLPLCTTAQTLVVPTAYNASAGNIGFNAPLSGGAVTYQLLINETELTTLMGQQLTGITFRSPVNPGLSVIWPESVATYADYNIYLSGSVAPASRSFTFADNITGTQSQVRSGPLVITQNAYPSGNPTNFGTNITFNTPYVYSGGHLLLEIRHGASNFTNRSVDAISSALPAYGTTINSAFALNETATTTTFGGSAAIVRFTHTPVPLPLELLQFSASATPAGSFLAWQTASEINFDRFTVEKSADGKLFHTIGTVQASGHAGSKQEYSYLDTEFKNTEAFYRLKITDRDGAYKYSGIRVVKPIYSGNSISVAPNPFQDELSLLFHITSPGEVTIVLYDLSGSVRYKETLTACKGQFMHAIASKDIANGIYQLELQGAVQRTMKLLKNR